MNKVLLTGRLTKDIEIRQTNSGKGVVMNSIAVKRDYKNANGEYETDFINIVVWSPSADYLKNYAKKGDLIEVVGRWQVRNYQDQQGNNRQANECIVENITILEKRERVVASNNDDLPPFKESASKAVEVDISDLPF